MPRRRQAKAQSVEDTRTPEEIAEERIAAWKRAEELTAGGNVLKRL